MKRIIQLVGLLGILAALQPLPAVGQEALQVMHIANEGVLIRSGGKAVLVDGLFRPYKQYASLSRPQRELLEAASPPFDGVGLILVSHIHGDHFHPQSAAAYLRSNPSAVLASSTQAVSALQSVLGREKPLMARLIEVAPDPGKRVKREFDGIQVEFLNLPHGSKRHNWIENLGHIIHMGGKTLLHVGDAEMNVETFRAYKLVDEKIDVAFLPYWYLLTEDGRKLVAEQIQPRHIVAVHVIPEEAETVCTRIKQLLPDAVCMRDEMQMLRY